MKTLKASGHQLANAFIQLKVLNTTCETMDAWPQFQEKLKATGLFPLNPNGINTLQINVGKMCNQTCKHCHVDAGPDRKEVMTRQTMQQCLEVLTNTDIPIVDLTGGAPEMNSNFRWFVEEIYKLGRKIIVRSNLTILVSNKKYHDLPRFFKEHQVEVISSLPYYSSLKTDAQRGQGVFEDSIRALKMLNAAGYGLENSGLILNLVYNPTGAFLPPPQASLQADFKQELQKRFGIHFNELFTITNMPISRFLDYLLLSGNYHAYMEKLINAFNPQAAQQVMCRNMISVSWDGYLYDCDFNQMLDLKIHFGKPLHIKDFDAQLLKNRKIIVNQHCYGCTAGSGSSCGGETVI